MSGNFEGIKTRRFGVEIEMTGITRCSAAKAIQKVLGGSIDHVGGSYDKYTVGDDKGRKWQIVFDSSIYARKKSGESASDYYKVELNSPILEFEDMDLLQEVIRALRKERAITGPDYDCGTHIHIDAADYTPQQIRNLVNLWSSKEDFLWDALQVSSARSNYCRKINREFVEELNRRITVSETLSEFTAAQINEFIAAVQEAKAVNVLALLMEYKNNSFAGLDPMAEFTLDW